MPRAKPQPADPLIAALIAKLPPPGGGWSIDKQKAWLKLMALALSTTYGGDVSAELEALPPPMPALPVPTVEAPKPAPTKPAEPTYPFYIDREGFARRKNGNRVTPEDVSDIIYDLRGEADPSDIIWADDTRGIGPNVLNGADINISAVF